MVSPIVPRLPSGYNEDAIIRFTLMQARDSTMNNEFQSRQIIPGRSHSAHVIEFHLPEAATVSLSILNDHGKVLEQVIENTPFASGRHEIEFNTAHWNGNVYFYRLAM